MGSEMSKYMQHIQHHEIKGEQNAVPTCISRDFTATTFIVHEDMTLLLLHRKLGKWFPPGGHVEPNELPHIAALREVYEETGLEVELHSRGDQLGTVAVLPQPYCILLEDINSEHQHIDLIYFARVTKGIMTYAEQESLAARWFSWSDLAEEQIAEDIRSLGRKAIEFYRIQNE